MDEKDPLEEIPVELLLWLLEYPRKWLNSGLLDEALIREQGLLSTEHHRFSMFRRNLETRSELNDAEIAIYLELTFEDNDQAMAQSARIELLLWRGLISKQFERLASSPEFANPLMQKLAARRRVLNRLAQSELNDELFADCLASRDMFVHLELLEQANLTQEQLASIAENGCNRAVRNIAQSRTIARRNS